MGTWRTLRLTWAVRPWRRQGRGWRLAAVAAAVAGSLVVAAAPAAAADVPPGTGPVPFCEGHYLTLLPNGLCFDGIYGTIRQVQNPPPGGFSGTAAQPATPRRLGAPGGVLAAVEQKPGATVAERSAGSLANGLSTAKKGGKLLMRGVTTVVGVDLAWQTGTWLGGLAAGGLCAAGVEWECTPQPADDYVPNYDVVMGDTGWLGPSTLDGVSFAPLAGLRAGQAHSGVLLARSGGGPTSTKLWHFYYSVPKNAQGTAYWPGGSQPINLDTNTWAGAQAVPDLIFMCAAGGTGGTQACADVNATLPDVLENKSPVPYIQPFLDAGGTIYAFPGSQYRPPDADPDPVRHFETSVQCSDGSVATALSADFHETDAAWPAMPVASCPDGSAPHSYTVTSVSAGAPPKEIVTSTVPEAVQQWQGEFPQCVDGGCTLTLVKKGPAGSDLGDCFDRVGRCSGWMADPNRDTDYECQYGMAGSRSVVALRECYIYGPTFDPEENSKGIVSGDPVTGDAPVTANGSDPGEGSDPGADGGGSCWPTGFGVFNPAGWVLTPIKCALTWAFVPRADVLAGALAEAGAAARNFGPFAYAIDAGAVVTGVIGAAYSGSCTGDAWRVDPAYFVWPCDPPFPGYQYLYALMVVFVVVGGAATGFVIVREAVAPR